MQRLLLFLLLALAGCGGTNHATDRFTYPRYEARYATGFELLSDGEGHSTLLRVHNPWQGSGTSCSELFLRRNDEPIPKGFTGQVLDGNASRIVSIADGVITECGTHEELVNTGGVYSQLYKTQNALALEAMK